MENNTQQEPIHLLDPSYLQQHQFSIGKDTMEQFWKAEAELVSWFKKPTKIVDMSNPPFIKWFPDGEINMCYNCLDKHIEDGFGNNKAIIWESCYGQPTEIWTYNDLYKEVNKLSSVLINKGIQKGDRVILYFPLIPQSFIALLACWRIGAIHVVIFGGFAAGELGDRIMECKPKAIITTSCGIEPRKKVVYMKNIDIALSKAESLGFNSKIELILHQRKDVLVVPQEDLDKIKQNHKNTLEIYDYTTELNAVDENQKVECVHLNSNDPMYILYTSGTSKLGKGVLRDVGGCVVTANFTMSKIMNLNRGEVSFNTSDIGWIVGHLFMVYGPLIRGATSLIMEGKPSGTPDCSVCFNLIQKHKAKIFYSCPTVIRLYKLEDPELKIISKYDLSSLETLAVSGERCDQASFEWALKIAGKDKMINDHWWQTESGYPIGCNNILIHRFPCIPGITGYPMLGFDLHLLNLEDHSAILVPKKKGLACIKYPTPPSFMTTLYGNDESFKNKFIKVGDDYYYNTGDLAEWMENGGIHILSRNDDMIKVCGHRLSSGRIEEVICSLEEVNQCGIASLNDKIKGETPLAFCVINQGITISSKDLTAKVNSIITSTIGAISRIKAAIVVPDLPKNKSGKIVRVILKGICNKQEIVVPASLDNPEIIEKIKKIYEEFCSAK